MASVDIYQMTTKDTNHKVAPVTIFDAVVNPQNKKTLDQEFEDMVGAVPESVAVDDADATLVTTALRKTEQVLTLAEKKQVRTNINAADADDLTQFSEEVFEKFTETDSKLSELGSEVSGKVTKAELQAEVTRATNAESALSKSIEAETTRATAAELELRKSINNEVLRAKEAEKELENNVNANRYGYNVTVNGLKGGVHTIETAIKDVPSKFRMLGQKITFRTENGDWATYHNESLSLDNYENVNDWVQEVGISEVQGDVNITNAPDYEDLTEAADGTIKFADKEYSKDSFSGLGRVYLRKNIVEGVNVLTQDMMSKPNTIYIVQYDYDLQGAEITIPEDCVLNFQGGSFNNGEIVLNKSKIIQGNFEDIKFNGETIDNIYYSEWFGIKEGFDCKQNLESMSELFKNKESVTLIFGKGKYYCSAGIGLQFYNCNNVVIKGSSKDDVEVSMIANDYSEVHDFVLFHFIKCANIDISNISLKIEVKDQLSKNVDQDQRMYIIWSRTSTSETDLDNVFLSSFRLHETILTTDIGNPLEFNSRKPFLGAVWLSGYYAKHGNKNIRIYDNSFEKCLGRIVYISAADGVEVYNNTFNEVGFTKQTTYRKLNGYAFLIRLLGVKNAIVTNNIINGTNEECTGSKSTERSYLFVVGKAMDDTGVDSEHIYITNNIVNFGYLDVYGVTLLSGKYIYVKNNVFKSEYRTVPASNQHTGVIFNNVEYTSDVSDCQITENLFIGVRRPISTNPDSEWNKDKIKNIVINNNISTFGYFDIDKRLLDSQIFCVKNINFEGGRLNEFTGNNYILKDVYNSGFQNTIKEEASLNGLDIDQINYNTSFTLRFGTEVKNYPVVGLSSFSCIVNNLIITQQIISSGNIYVRVGQYDSNGIYFNDWFKLRSSVETELDVENGKLNGYTKYTSHGLATYNGEKWIDANGRTFNHKYGSEFPVNLNNNRDAGFTYFHTSYGKPTIWTGRKWVDSNGNDIEFKQRGGFVDKPILPSIGYGYFCEDRKTPEGTANGIIIYHKGNNVWVDSLGRVVE